MSQIHHFEVTTRSLHQRVYQFQNQLGFKVFAHRGGCDRDSSAVAVYTGSIVAVIQDIDLFKESYHDEESCLPATDWISNVALIMSSSEFGKTIDRITSKGTEIVGSLTYISKGGVYGTNDFPINRRKNRAVTVDSYDSHEASVCENVHEIRGSQNLPVQASETEPRLETEHITVKSPFPGVYHTIMTGQCDCQYLKNDNSFTTDLLNWFGGTCLSGFSCCPQLGGRPCELCNQFTYVSRVENPLVTHIDHVTFACDMLMSSAVSKWYSDCLGFVETDFMNSKRGKGFILKDSNGAGMKLSAMQYWMCSEVCLGNVCAAVGKPVQLIFAEPLSNDSPNQVTTFLNSNGGPGVQHIAFHTSSITQSVAALMRNGVSFVFIPPEYYSLVEKAAEIEKAGEDIALLKEHNVLIDTDNGTMDHDEIRYLLQVFSHSLFDGDTFFLELITRCGEAKGFGAGNITALWKALDVHLKKLNFQS